MIKPNHLLKFKKRFPRLSAFHKKHLKYYALLIGISSLFWLLLRSAGKPSRLQYPCQKASIYNVIVFLGPGISGSLHKLIHLKTNIHPNTVLRSLIIVPVFFISIMIMDFVHNYNQSIRKSEKMQRANESSPIGIQTGKETASGLNIYNTSPFALANLAAPNDVISIHDSQATNWDYTSDYYWQYVNQDIVDTMIAMGVMYLTRTNNTNDAWKTLVPYQAGESVLIKFNFNNSGCTTENNKIEPLAETANAIIDDLTAIGIPGERIWIADPSRNIPERFRDMIKDPNIQYYGRSDCEGVPNYHTVTHVDPGSSAASFATCPEGEKILPFQVFVDADHLINVPKFLSHGSYVTLALKNHYGSVLYENFDRSTMHYYFNESGNAAGCNLDSTNILADINNNPHIRDKTRLIIGEGLFGNQYSNRGNARRWDIFGNGSPNMYFFSTDPISISSVMTDYLMAERGWQSHQQLHAGAKLGLGVHEHWDNFENKKYSSFNYLVIDRDKSESIPPLNHRPVAMNDSISIIEDSLVFIDVLVNDYDPDGVIDSSTVAIVKNPSNGKIFNPDSVSGTVTYEPDSGFFGVDTFSYTVDDNSGVASNVALVIVHIMLSTDDSISQLNQPPVAMNDSIYIIEDSPVFIDVLDNDYDPDGVIDSSTVTIVKNPSNGKIFNPHPVSGTVTYEPNSGFFGVDTFTYTVDDNSGVASNVASVMVNTMLSTNISENEYFLLPTEFFLGQNYPNPFRASTKITYSISHADFVILKIYNNSGQEVQTLVNKYKGAGNHTIIFDANNFSSGIYHYKLQVGNKTIKTKKMILMR